jgi:hypothetical protein
MSPRSVRSFVFVLLLAAPTAIRADSADDADKLIGAIDGVYKRHFKTTFYDGSKDPDEEEIDAEDVVELARHDRTHIYVRAELQFRNGHSCSIAGLAGYEAGAFVYHQIGEDQDPAEPPCTLRITVAKNEIVLSDQQGDGPSTCASSCGANGSLAGHHIERSRRKPIRYLERLKASREYKHAVEELAAWEHAPRPAPAKR